jgi:hypothetical protein
MGDADIFSTVEDLFLWDQALYTDKLLSEELKEIMFTPFLNNYAYGWKLLKIDLSEPHDSLNAYWHSGTLFGFNSIIIRCVEDKHLIVVLLNNTGSINLKETLTHGFCREIINILYDRSFQQPKK